MDKLLQWLEASYKQGTRLNGLIYLYRISDPRMAGSAMKNLSMFRKLCGSDNFKNVVLGTNFWGNVNQAIGEDREQELATNNEMWGSIARKGSKVVRVLEDRSSNLATFEDIARNNGKVVIEAQKEMLAGKSRLDTAAALDFGTMIYEFRAQQQQETYREKIRLQNEEKEREQVQQQKLTAMRVEIGRLQRVAKENAEREERLQKKMREKEREDQRLQEQKEREEVRAEVARLQVLASQALGKQQEEEANRVYRREYICRSYVSYDQSCSRCRCNLHKKKSYYYRKSLSRVHTSRFGANYYYVDCCFCSHDGYNSCSRCGSRCLEDSHPPMKTRPTVDKDGCMIM